MAKTLFELLEAVPDEDVLAVTGDAMVSAPVVESTDDVQQGGVFVARKGRSADGHAHIPKAIERGAAAVIGELPLENVGVPYVQVRDTQAILGLLAAAFYEFPSQQLVVM
jgi:UDP-N-acetylmuramoyl-L-alanyl-D-glutamate--2,6-diaminopimelate ligase